MKSVAVIVFLSIAGICIAAKVPSFLDSKSDASLQPSSRVGYSLDTLTREFSADEFEGEFTLYSQYMYGNAPECPQVIRQVEPAVESEDVDTVRILRYEDMDIGGLVSTQDNELEDEILQCDGRDGYLEMFNSFYLRGERGSSVRRNLQTLDLSESRDGDSAALFDNIFNTVWDRLRNKQFWVGQVKDQGRKCNRKRSTGETVEGGGEWFTDDEVFIFIDDSSSLTVTVTQSVDLERGDRRRVNVTLKGNQRYLLVTGRGYTCIYNVRSEFNDGTRRSDSKCSQKCDCEEER